MSPSCTFLTPNCQSLNKCMNRKIEMKNIAEASFEIFDGRKLWTSQTAPQMHESVKLGTGDFTISVQASWNGCEAGSGDLLSQFDSKERRGFCLTLSSLAAACTSQTHTRKLVFGIDAGTDPNWVDVGNPGGQTVYPFALCEFRGQMHVGVFTNAGADSAAVYRFDEALGWVDCGFPGRGNAASAMVVLDNTLYVADSTYDARGTDLSMAMNMNMESDGRIYAFDGTKWRDCGRVSECLMVGCLVVLDGTLYATAFQQFTDAKSRPDCGLYRMVHVGKWEFCGNPGERVVPIIPWRGKLVAGGWNKGGIYCYDPVAKSWDSWGRPPFEETTQIYSFVQYKGELLAGTWRVAKVFAIEGPNKFRDIGTMGNELEVMAMAVFNGKLYGGTLPLGQIYRFEHDNCWSLIDRLDHTDTKYRRIWSMAVTGGHLYCGAVPSGHIYRLIAGDVVSSDEPLPKGWHHIVARRKDNRLSLHVDGRRVAEQSQVSSWLNDRALDLTTDAKLVIGGGPSGSWQGEISKVSIHLRALSEDEIAEAACHPPEMQQNLHDRTNHSR